MTNNINNLGFNAINFNGKGEKPKNDAPPVCDCHECREIDAEAASALDAMGRAQVGKPYKFDPKNVEDDVKEFEEEYYNAKIQCDLRDVVGEYEQALIDAGVEPTSAYEKAEIFRACLESTQNV